MNLKEAFRYQNKIQNLMDEAESILHRDRNVTKVENTVLRHKVNPDAEDETSLFHPWWYSALSAAIQSRHFCC